MHRSLPIFLTVIFLTACGVTPTPAEIVDERGVIMRLVPAGEFIMGSELQDTRPTRTVFLDSYYIDKYEVTNARYEDCVTVAACTPPHESSSRTRAEYFGNAEYADYPVVNVDWNQALTYCRWRGGGLPTEAQWEKAASWNAEKKEKYHFPWGNSLDMYCALANSRGFEADCVGDTTRVGEYPLGASPYGLLDMGGNVMEWVADWFDAYPGSDTYNPYYGRFYRVERGGSVGSYNVFVRTEMRARGDPAGWGNGTGFRCAKNNP